jgi:hypothetical protein
MRDCQRRADRRCSMIRHQVGVVRRQERLEGIGESGRAWSRVGDERNGAHRKDNFRKNTCHERLPSNRKPCRRRRMRVYDGLDVRSAGIDPQVHGNLRRGAVRTADPSSIHPQLHQILGPNVNLRHPRRGHEQPIRTEADGHVALRPRDQTALVQPLAHPHDGQAGRAGPAHGHSSARCISRPPTIV